ncbi:hypothetical protein TNCV_1300251 [Trichonephila clavipes]|nr:hypothetical protein TNCV_1300251 [Trichonephila clavipes]
MCRNGTIYQFVEWNCMPVALGRSIKEFGNMEEEQLIYHSSRLKRKQDKLSGSKRIFRLLSSWASNLLQPGASNYLNPPLGPRDHAFSVAIDPAENHDTAAHIRTDPPPFLAVGNRQLRSYACAGVLQICVPFQQVGQRGFDAASTLPSDASSERQTTSQGQILTEENFHSYRPGGWQTWSRLLIGQRRAQLSALPRVEVVVCFRVITGHDYLQSHLLKIGLADSLLCPLCKSRPMTGEHLSDCPAVLHVLPKDNYGVLLPARVTSALYWTARRLMSERTLAGVI